MGLRFALCSMRAFCLSDSCAFSLASASLAVATRALKAAVAFAATAALKAGNAAFGSATSPTLIGKLRASWLGAASI